MSKRNSLVPVPLTRVYNQGKVWLPAAGQWIRIKDMTPRHRLNSARMLMRQAETRAMQLGFAELCIMRGAPDVVVDDWLREDGERLNDPQKWMRETKLYRALIKGLQVDAAPASVDRLFAEEWTR